MVISRQICITINGIPKNMNIKNIISILAVSLIMPKGFAQESSSSLEEPADQKIPLRIEDCYSGKNYPKRLYDIQWIPESYKISYSQRGKLFIQNVYSLKIDSSISISLINEGFMGKSLGLKRLPSLTWVDETRFRFFHQGDLYTYDIIAKETKLKRKIGKFEVVDVHPSKLNAAAIIDKNLMVFTGNGKTQISSDGGNGIVYGQAVHRSEFGITKGLFWSNGGAKIAFYRKDERRVKDINELDISNTPATRRSF
ncbi:MAG: DPP IV N-terminal domain-containing protein, partial [Bacteroidia bacterium]|nr:DPP IV N-terminal domain-containing protein [Bacteroidia bacterium]